MLAADTIALLLERKHPVIGAVTDRQAEDEGGVLAGLRRRGLSVPRCLPD